MLFRRMYWIFDYDSFKIGCVVKRSACKYVWQNRYFSIWTRGLHNFFSCSNLNKIVQQCEKFVVFNCFKYLTMWFAWPSIIFTVYELMKLRCYINLCIFAVIVRIVEGFLLIVQFRTIRLFVRPTHIKVLFFMHLFYFEYTNSHPYCCLLRPCLEEWNVICKCKFPVVSRWPNNLEWGMVRDSQNTNGKLILN